MRLLLMLCAVLMFYVIEVMPLSIIIFVWLLATILLMVLVFWAAVYYVLFILM
jgi:hypothetical protein